METLRQKYNAANQGHVFEYFDKLSESERNNLVKQLEAIEPNELNQIVAKAKAWSPDQSNIEPLPSSAVASTIDESDDQIEEWRKIGVEAIQQGKVAVLLLAGGQGTRLGSSAPKGCYDIGLPSHKSLFQLQAERIAKLGSNIPWYIMTSGPTRAPTESFFKENNFFGVPKDNVIFFEQGTIPCITNDGKIILEGPGVVSVAPDGNGGVYKALLTGGVLDDLKKRGIEHVHMYCVDNSLVKVADPVFIGFSASRQADVATKVVRKRDSNEQVGVIATRANHPAVIEYSEISPELREAKDPENPSLLKLRAANIVNHYYSTAFLLRSPELAREAMPFHIANKKIPYYDGSAQKTVKPEKPNGIKLEQFVFDIFSEIPLAKFATLEVARSSEFSPVKNAPGTKEDSPDTARADLMNEGKVWLENAGARPIGPTEVSPKLSFAGEGLEKFANKEIAQDYLD